MREKSYYPDVTGSFSQESRYSWTQQGTRACAINIRCEWNCRLPSVSYYWWPFGSTISHLLSLPPSVTLLACSFDASPCIPAVVLYYRTFWVCTVRFKILSLFFVSLMYYLYEKDCKPITMQYRITDCVRYLDQLCWAYKQIGLMNVLLEWNSFTCKGLTVLEVKFLPCWASLVLIVSAYPTAMLFF